MTAAISLGHTDHLAQMFARFSAGTATRDDVEDLANAAARIGLAYVQVQVHRWQRPAADGTVRLLGRSGPHSCGDRKATKVGQRLWAAWWDVAELRRWLKAHPAKGGKRA